MYAVVKNKKAKTPVKVSVDVNECSYYPDAVEMFLIAPTKKALLKMINFYGYKMSFYDAKYGYASVEDALKNEIGLVIKKI